MLQKIFPEDSPYISTSERVCVHAGRSTSTQIEDSNEVVEGSLSRETYLAEIRIHLAPTFTRSEPLTISFLGLYERWNQVKKIPATISQMKDQVKEIIVSIPLEILKASSKNSTVAFETVLWPLEKCLKNEWIHIIKFWSLCFQLVLFHVPTTNIKKVIAI